ncbi:MAG: GspE/PulE family protein [Planctomycetota bacterium]|jgi:type IV pilus assembly protein PilB
MAGRLGDILVDRGLLTADQLQEALATRGLLGETLLRNNWVTRRQLGSALSEQFEVPYENLSADDIPAQIVRLVPEQFARTRRIVPIRVRQSWMLLAMEAPDDIEAISEVELLTGYKVDPAISMREDILQALDRGFDERVTAQQTAVDIRIAELEAARDAGELHIEVEQDEESPVVRLVKSILIGAVNAGASDIHLEPHKPQMRIRYRVDGELQQVMTIPNDSEEAVVGRIKVMADMDTTEKRRPQDGNLTVEENGQRASFRVSCIPCVDGEKVVMRVLDESNKEYAFESLGMAQQEIEVCRDLISKPYGMIVVTGPTGSGKTTTMYTMLTSIDSSEKNVSTIEDPVEFWLPGINQVQANNEHGMGFANGLKYLMRQDPDVILVGEIRDHETATAAVQAALTGHLLISTLHTNDAVGAITRLNDLGLDHFKIAGSLLASMAQRLLRKICPYCREENEPNPRMLEYLLEGRLLPDGATFYRGAGCRKCLGTGFIGRIPIYEIMQVSMELEKGIEAGLPTSKLRDLAMADGMTVLPQAGMQQALAGLTTVEEVYYKLST